MGPKKKSQQNGAQNQSNTTIPQNAIDAFNRFLDSFIKCDSYVLKMANKCFLQKKDVETTFELFCKYSQDDKNKDKNFNDVFNALETQNDTIIDILNHAIWLWALPNDRKTNWVLKNKKSKPYNDELLKVKGVAGGGSGYVQKKTNGVRFVLYLFTKMQGKNSIETVKKEIINACGDANKKYYKSKYDLPDGVKNLLLHLCDPSKYQSIAASADKEKIVRTFYGMITKNKPKTKKKAIEKLDETLNTIKENVFKSNDPNFSFYKNPFPLLLWKREKETDLSLAQQLEYKKAMILYGPPGTSKTYTATELAKEIILRHMVKEDKKTAFNLLNSIDDKELDYLIKERIKNLQFHININYEDFIAGQTIKDNTVITQEGFIYDVIKKAQKPFEIQGIVINNTPFIVILDEINRTDISRVFGELFTAIEKRGEDVDLLLPTYNIYGKKTEEKLILNIPENVYFIGTMNEIDFSLERVDFALRRRFIWELHDYDKDTLESIINYKLEDKANSKFVDFDNDGIDLNTYCETCTKLNNKVKEVMSEAYHIGHTFFAEIVDVYIKLKQSNTTVQNPWKKAKEILWQISIKPTLEAYCGTMNKEQRESTINQLKDLFKSSDI